MTMDLRVTEMVVQRDAIPRHEWRSAELPSEPPAGGVLLQVEQVALSANNVTLALVGDVLGYWGFFPATEPRHGKIPAWGIGTVLRSAHPGAREGDRLLGYYPIATHLLVPAAEPIPGGFIDRSATRAGFHPMYNEYWRYRERPSYEGGRDGAWPLLWPLFVTSYLLRETLADQGFMGAERVFVTSASSKTALALGFLLTRPGAGRREVVGVTSAAHAAWVRSLGAYDAVLTYDEVDAAPADRPALVVDVAGDNARLARLCGALGDRLRFTWLVGVSHWKEFRGLVPDVPIPGPPPIFFFAPALLEERRAQWGREGLEARLEPEWAGFLAASRAWLELVEARGQAAIGAAYRDLLEGRVEPSRGLLLAP